MNIIISFSLEKSFWAIVDDNGQIIHLCTSGDKQLLCVMNKFRQVCKDDSSILQYIHSVMFDVGPGYYTGLRMGAVFASGLSTLLDLPLYEFSWCKYLLKKNNMICFIQNSRIYVQDYDTSYIVKFNSDDDLKDKMKALSPDVVSSTSLKYRKILLNEFNKKYIDGIDPYELFFYAREYGRRVDDHNDIKLIYL